MDLKESLEQYHSSRNTNSELDPSRQSDGDSSRETLHQSIPDTPSKVPWYKKFTQFFHSDPMWKQIWNQRKRRVGRGSLPPSMQPSAHAPHGKRKLSFSLGGRDFHINTAKLFKFGAIAAFVGIIFLTLGMTATFAWISRDLPQPDKIVRKEGFETKIFDRNEKLLYELYVDEKRVPAKFEDIPDYLKKGTIAIEDKNFYQHDGFDPLGYARIVYNALFKRRIIGGSTLTQQIVKNILLSSERTLTRKMKELILAIQIEQKYDKDQILQIYLNEAPYGGTAWGVAAAADMYFGKEVKDLNLIESAVLAGMPQSPSYYSPYGAYPDAFKGRTQDVLRRMREDGYITADQEKQALVDLDNLQFQDPGGEIKAPHFVMYVKSVLEERYGQNFIEQGGLKVITSLDLDLHQKVQEVVAEEIEKVAESHHITNGAVTVMDPNTGEILSMVGSRSYFDKDYDGKVNVTTSLRQPGSSIKPVTFVTALKEGWTPESLIMDVRTEFPGASADKPYVPKNYNGKFMGPVSLRNALGNSLNIPSVKLLAMVGIEDMMQTGYEMGLNSFQPTADQVNRLGLSVTLGGGEVTLLDLTTAYSAFANGGKKVEPVSVLKVVNRDGKTLEEFKPTKGKQVLDPAQAFLISHMLADNSARQSTFGPNSLLHIPWRTIAVKTGTTNDQRDNWAIGWDPQIIVGVWVGNNDNSEMKTVASGVSGASPIWRRSILAALEQKPVKEFERPANIESIALDKISGYPAHDDFESKESLIIKGTQPTGNDPIHVKLKICKGQEDKLAPDTLVAKGEYEEKEFFVFKEEDPFAGGGVNRWQKGIEEWAAGMEDKKYHPPTQYCEGNDDVVVQFQDPGDKKRVENKFEVKLRVAASDDIEKVELYANNEKKGEMKDKPYRMDVRLDDGQYELKAIAFVKNGKKGEGTVKVAVNRDWEDPKPSPTPTSTPTPTTTPTPTPNAIQTGNDNDNE